MTHYPEWVYTQCDEGLYRPDEAFHAHSNSRRRGSHGGRDRRPLVARAAVRQGALGTLMARCALACVTVVVLCLAWCAPAHAGRCHSRQECHDRGWAWHHHSRSTRTARVVHAPRERQEPAVTILDANPYGDSSWDIAVAFPSIPAELATFLPNAAPVSVGRPEPIPPASPEKPRMEDAPPKTEHAVARAGPLLPAAIGCGSTLGLAFLALGLGWRQRRRHDRMIIPASLVPPTCPDVPRWRVE
jgi:hypothetical protein